MASISYYYSLDDITMSDVRWITETFEGRAVVTTMYNSIDVTYVGGAFAKVPTSMSHEIHITTERDRLVFLLKYPEAYMTEMAYHPDE